MTTTHLKIETRERDPKPMGGAGGAFVFADVPVAVRFLMVRQPAQRLFDRAFGGRRTAVTLEQFLAAISVVPFAGTFAEIEVARTHLNISCAAIWGSGICLCATSGWRFENGDIGGTYLLW